MNEEERIIALYLPQYHPFKENDEWWGKGFTEWTNVGKAKPLFKGHYQPKVPADLGYYDLRLPIIREQQAQLAKEAGIEGFMYWHYWFGNGKRLMETIFDEVLKSGKPDFPFCLAWANHSWYAKNWNSNDTKGKDKLLIEQKYLGKEDYRKHYELISKAFKDKRYIKIGNKPLFHIYNAKDVPDDFLILWNNWAIEDGFDGVYFTCRVLTNGNGDFDKDYWINKGYSSVSPDRLYDFIKRGDTKYFVNKLKGFIEKKIGLPSSCYSYKKAYPYFVNKKYDILEDVIPTIIPNFDHSPRSSKIGLIFKNSTPELFREHLKDVKKVVENKSNKIIYLRSWNEWGEGNYIEPDLKYGKEYIHALHEIFNKNV